MSPDRPSPDKRRAFPPQATRTRGRDPSPEPTDNPPRVADGNFVRPHVFVPVLDLLPGFDFYCGRCKTRSNQVSLLDVHGPVRRCYYCLHCSAAVRKNAPEELDIYDISFCGGEGGEVYFRCYARLAPARVREFESILREVAKVHPIFPVGLVPVTDEIMDDVQAERSLENCPLL